MKSSLYERARMFLQAHHKKSIWYRIVSVLAVCVVFVTTYMLVLPAITMERPTICGMQEHYHTAECYSSQYSFICGGDEAAGHEHTDDCLMEVSVLTCTLPEHYHVDSCYAQDEEQGGAAEFIGNADEELIIDNTPEQQEFSELSFLEDENGSSDGQNDGVVVESESETETETETETDNTVYYCGREAHVHSAECFDENNNRICGKETHEHTEKCLIPPESETETETETETQTTETETAKETETTAATTEAVSETETETEVQTTEAATVTEPQTEATETETETEAQTTEAETETETQTTEAEIVTEPQTEATETETETMTAAETEDESESESETASETETAETETETQTTEAESAKETETESETETTQQPQMNSWGWGGFEGPGFEDNGVFVSGENQKESDTETEAESAGETESEAETESKTETEPQYICGLVEHVHTEECYNPMEELVCGLEEHTHTEDCLAAAESESEAESASESETVSETETAETETESASEAETESETETDTETEPQYICGLEEHTHTEACYDEAGNLVCGLEEHTHSEACTAAVESESESETESETDTETEPQYICGLEEHTHTEACYDEAGNLVCGLEEHSHTEECIGIEETESESETDIDQQPETEEAQDYSATSSAFIEGEAPMMDYGIMTMSISRDAVDLRPYITGADIYPKSDVKDGQKVQVTLDYKIYSSVLKSAGTTKLEYELPEGLSPYVMPGSTSDEGDVIDSDTGEVIGHYTITKEGKITIELTPDFVNSGNTITGNITFWSDINSEGTDDEGKKKFSFSDEDSAEVEITVEKKTESESGETETKEKHDIYVDKSYTYDAATKTAKYTVVIGSENGTSSEVTFDDTLELNGAKATLKDLTITGSDGTTYRAEDYFTIVDGSIKMIEGKKLPKLEAGQRYTITYDVEYDFEDVNGTVKLYNRAYARDDDYNQHSDDTTITFKHTYLTKTGARDWNSDKIKWTIEVNDFGADLEGYVLRDMLQKSGIDIPLPEKIVVDEYDEKGEKVNTFTITGDELKKGFTFLESDDRIKDTKHRFVLTYETDTSDAGFYAKYKNDATLTGGGHSFDAGNEQEVKNDSGVLQKNYVEQDTSNNKPDLELVEGEPDLRHYEWKSVVTAPKGGIQEGTTYTDSMSLSVYPTGKQVNGVYHYITKEQLDSLTLNVEGSWSNLARDEDYQIYVKADGNEYEVFSGQEGPFTEFKVKFLKPFSEGTKVEIHYWTTADLSAMSDGDVFTFNNTAVYAYNGWSVSAMDSNKESKGGLLKKLDIGGEAGHYVYDESKGIMYYALQVNETHSAIKQGDGWIEITDTLPEGTTLYRQPYDLEPLGYTCSYDSLDAAEYRKLPVRFFFCNSTGMTSQLWPGKEQGLNGSNTEWKYNDETRELKMRINSEVFFGRQEDNTHSVFVFYAVQIVDNLGGEQEKTYKNDARITVNGKEEGSDSVTNTVTASYITKGINPDIDSSELDEKDVAYRVVVNPTKAKLNGGHSLTLTDKVTYVDGLEAVTLKRGSFHLYGLHADGTRGKEIDKNLYTVTYGEKTAVDGTKYYEMEIVLEDETAYIVEYVYTFALESTLEPGTKVKVKNDIAYSGEYSEGDDSSTDKEFEIGASSSQARTDRIVLIKVDEDNQVIYLPDAVFDLYIYEGELSQADWNINDSRWIQIKEYRTGVNGTVNLTGLEPNKAYRLVEKEAPTNYELNPTPYYFYLYDEKKDLTLPEGFKEAAHALGAVNSFVLTNKKGDSDKTSIGVEKKWIDADGKLIVVDESKNQYVTDALGRKVTGVKVGLYRTTEQGLQDGGEFVRESVVVPDDEGKWYYTFGHLPVDNSAEEGKTEDLYYYYYVREIGAIVEADDGSEVEVESVPGFLSSLDKEGAIAEGKVTITNTQQKSISVEKVWKDAEGNVIENPSVDDVRDIEVTLYRAEVDETETEPETETEETETETEVEITVTLSNHWKTVKYPSVVTLGKGQSITILSNYFESGRGINILEISCGESKLEYDILESGLINGEEKVKKIAISIPNDVDGKEVTVCFDENWINGPDYTVGVSEKQSGGDDPAPDTPATKNPIKYQGGKKVESVTLNADNNWKYTWDNLDGEGYYYVLENVPEGYTAEYEYDPSAPGKGAPIKKVTITNTPDDNTHFRVKKEWVGVEPNSNYVVNAKLHYMDSEGTDATIDFTLSEDNNWQKSWENLDGTNFWVEEISVTVGGVVQSAEEYAVTYSDNNGSDDNNATITITNTKQQRYTSVSVEKRWLDRDGVTSLADPPEELTVQLYRKNASGGWDEVPASENGTVKLTGPTWSHTWENLPVGTYRVEETKPEGYWKVTYQVDDSSAAASENSADAATDGGKIIITNTKDDTDISVEKIWQDRNNETLTGEVLSGKSVTVQLWRKGTAPEEDAAVYAEEYVTLSNENATNSKDVHGHYGDSGWKYTWTNLPKGEYYVKEISTGADGHIYTVTYRCGTTSNNEPSAVTTTDGTITITNKQDDTDISVEKKWVGFDGEPLKEGALAGKSITVELWKKASDPAQLDSYIEGKDITLNGVQRTSDFGTFSADGWGFTWKNLEKGEYYVKEKLEDGEEEKYDITYSSGASVVTAGSNEEAKVAVESGTITITNTEKHTSITVEKVWKSSDGTDATWTLPESITVQLYRKTDAGDFKPYGESVKLKADEITENNWKYTWENLPLGEYYVEESPALTNYIVTYGAEGAEFTDSEDAKDPKKVVVSEGTITITNTEDSTEFEVKKEWENVEASKQSGITVQLYRSHTKPESAASAAGINTVSNARAASVAMEGPDFEGSMTSITLRVGYWLNGSNEYVQRPAAGWIRMVVWQCDANGNIIGSNPVARGTLSYENQWSVTIGNLPGDAVIDGKLQKLSYLVQYEAGGAGNSIERAVLMNNLDSGGCLVSSANRSNELTLSAIIGEGYGASSIANIRTTAAGGASADLPSDAEPVRTISSPLTTINGSEPSGSPEGGNAGERVEGDDGQVTLNSVNNWTHKWENLPKKDADGKEWYYYAREVEVPDGFKESHVDTVNGTVITNTRVISVTVEKKWEGFDGHYKVDEEFEVTVMLQKVLSDGSSQTNVEGQQNPITLSASNNWTHTWTDLLPLSSGEEYTVVERAVKRKGTAEGADSMFNEYTVTYTGSVTNESGKITITNEYNPTPFILPETGGPGTLPYTVGGALLTAFATLLLYIQNKRRKEGQGTS